MNAEQKQKFIDKWKYQQGVGSSSIDCSEQLSKDLDALISPQIGEEVIKQAYADGFNKGFVVDWETAETKTITSYYEEWKQLHPELFRKTEIDKCNKALFNREQIQLIIKCLKAKYPSLMKMHEDMEEYLLKLDQPEFRKEEK